MNLTGRVALVTGAADSIGAQIASCFAAHGCFVYVTDVNADGARAHAGTLGPNAEALRMDVADGAEVKGAVATIIGERGHLDILVNNAGRVSVGAFSSTSQDEWDKLVAVNLGGVFNCVQAAAPPMIANRSGAIINIASVSAEKGGGALGNVWYGATKAAVVAMTKGLARELGPAGIRVNAIAPGVVDTAMVKQFLTPELREKILARFPLGRLATTHDVANLALFLASDMSSFITGETIAVDGGFLQT